MNLTYIVGVPGSGKSTLVAGMLEGRHRQRVSRKPVLHELRQPDGLVILGATEGTFSGTDAMSMSVQPRVIDWLAAERPRAVLGEGDRLATLGFLAAMAMIGDVTVVHLDVPADVAEERRARRAELHGLKPQDPTWVQGRATKVERLVATWRALGGTVLTLDDDAARGSLLGAWRPRGS